MPPSQAIPNSGFENIERGLISQGGHLLANAPHSLYNIYHPWAISKDRYFAVIAVQLGHIGRIR